MKGCRSQTAKYIRMHFVPIENAFISMIASWAVAWFQISLLLGYSYATALGTTVALLGLLGFVGWQLTTVRFDQASCVFQILQDYTLLLEVFFVL